MTGIAATANGAFSAKLELVLKALSMSRGRLAADLGVDKSLVGRWASGAVTPSQHNLSNLTQLLASKRPGFTMHDWDRDLDSLAAQFGVSPPAVNGHTPVNGHVPPPRAADLTLLAPLLDQARMATERRGKAYEGFWRTTRPSVMMPGLFFHDFGMIRRGASGMLDFQMGGSGLLWEGWMLPAEGQLFVILYDTVGLTPVFLIFNGVPLPKAELLDGIVTAAALDAARTPSSYPIILERIGDLTGDKEADDARCRELLNQDTRAPIDGLPDNIKRHLLRDIGPEAAAKGGPLLLLAPATGSLTRGVSAGGHLHG
jgi:transcriptional regulator with XRE-family HTH domain